jgi:hypothetical protein
MFLPTKWCLVRILRVEGVYDMVMPCIKNHLFSWVVLSGLNLTVQLMSQYNNLVLWYEKDDKWTWFDEYAICKQDFLGNEEKREKVLRLIPDDDIL